MSSKKASSYPAELKQVLAALNTEISENVGESSCLNKLRRACVHIYVCICITGGILMLLFQGDGAFCHLFDSGPSAFPLTVKPVLSVFLLFFPGFSLFYN